MRQLFFGIVLMLSTTLSVASELTERLLHLVTQGQMQQAYQLALTQLDSEAGNPDFDLAFGIAAIEVGQVNEGVFALERVVYLQPDNHRARLEYARGLFILGQDALARQTFTQVLAQNPPPSVAAKIDQFLNALRRRESRYQTSANGYIGFSWGYDDNINSAPDSQLDRVQLNAQSLGRGDQFSLLTFGSQVFQPLTKNRKLYGRWDSTIRRYRDEHDQDNGNHSLTLGHQWNAQHQQWDLSLNAQQYQLDDRRYRILYGPTLRWTRVISQHLSLQTAGSWLFFDHPHADWRDSRQWQLSGRLFGTLDLPLSPSVYGGLFVGDERSDDQSTSSRAAVDRQFFGLQGGGQLSLASNWSLLSSATAQHSDYEGDDLFYGVAREDYYYALDLELKQLLDSQWQLSLNLNYSHNDSNIELYDYRRRQLSLSMRYEF